jgi:hypothetical protein
MYLPWKSVQPASRRPLERLVSLDSLRHERKTTIGNALCERHHVRLRQLRHIDFDERRECEQRLGG